MRDERPGLVTLEAAQRPKGAGCHGLSVARPRPLSALLRLQGDSWWAKVATILRSVTGMPDYRAHLEHLRQCHPGSKVPSEREFFEEFVRARYGDGPIRCC
jgi:uncharacterized short protein YbdD (DUF466 family)